MSNIQQRLVPWMCVAACLYGPHTVAVLQGEEALARFERTEMHMGTEVRIVAYAPNRQLFMEASDAAFHRIALLDQTLSDYRSDSELMRLCASAPHERPVSVSEDLYAVLRLALQISQVTDGAFDVTIGNVSRLWRRARRQHEVPSAELLRAALATVDYRQIQLVEPSSVQLVRPGVRIDLGAIAKGYAGDKALETLRAYGISAAMVDAGGDLVIGDAPPGTKGWPIGVASLKKGDPPSHTFTAACCGVATSGDLWQFIQINGRRYSHIIDPRTGWGVEGPRSVTVVAKDGATADALATAISILDSHRGLHLAHRFGACVLIMARDGDDIRVSRSPDFPSSPPPK